MRNRKWLVLVWTVALILALTLNVSASDEMFVFDEADLLTQAEELELAAAAANLSYNYGCGVYIVTMWDYNAYGSNVLTAAENFFLDWGLGMGNDGSGVLLLLSMAERDYALIAHGSIGNGAFTDYGKDVLCEQFLDDFGDNNWYTGFSDYVLYSGEFLEYFKQGTPVDVDQDGGSDLGLALVMILLIPAAIAGVVCGIMVSSMKTARKKTHADDYHRGVQITGRHDRFLTRTVVRQRIENSSSSGGTTVGSRGFSGKSGKF